MKKISIFIITLVMVSNLFSGTIKIDMVQKAEPISPYIYGQFIEHLGKCIYGGIWAEMLLDRKFYYPVTDDFNPWGTADDPFWRAGDFKHLAGSPWQVIGPKGSVTMDTQNPYTGEHTPIIKLADNGTFTGIRQGGLELVRDKHYTGRIVLSGDASAAPVIVRLTSKQNTMVIAEITTLSADYQTYPVEFTSGIRSNDISIEIVSKGKGEFRIGTLSLMPADNIKGWRKDVVALLKELDSPVYRWPGGNFVSGYNWRDGIGERDKRPPRKNPAWKGVEHNDVGIHEYMELMQIIDSEPFVAVNTGLGTVEEVAEEVEYFLGSVDTPMGKLRAANGHTEPWHVDFWAVGNEMFGSWQLGHMPLSEYVKKHNEMAKAMWAVNPDIQLIGVGEVGEWSEMMLKECADYMNLISEHIYCKEIDDVPEHVAQLKNDILKRANAHRKYRKEINGLAEKDIRIAMDEWNFWYGDYIYGELGVRYHLKDALGVAMGLHEYFRNSDLYFMANYAQTVNVIGCIKTTPTTSGFATTGLPLKLYRKQFGTLPLTISGDTGAMDISAALTEDSSALTVAVVNPTDNAEKVTLDLGGTKLTSACKSWTIRHDDPNAYNVPGFSPAVSIQESDQTLKNNTLIVPGYAIVLYRFELK